MKPPHDTRQLTKPKPSSGQYQPRRESEARSQSTDAQPANQKPKPPVAVKPVILVSDLTDPGVSPSPWEREQKEQEIKRLEEEARRLRQHEIQELEALGDRLSSQGRERLRRLRLDEEFDRRVREASSRDEDDAGVDSDTEMGERASVSNYCEGFSQYWVLCLLTLFACFCAYFCVGACVRVARLGMTANHRRYG